MKETRIIDSKSLTSLVSALNRALEEGWEIHGGLAYGEVGMYVNDGGTWAVLLTRNK